MLHCAPHHPITLIPETLSHSNGPYQEVYIYIYIYALGNASMRQGKPQLEPSGGLWIWALGCIWYSGSAVFVSWFSAGPSSEIVDLIVDLSHYRSHYRCMNPLLLEAHRYHIGHTLQTQSICNGISVELDRRCCYTACRGQLSCI